MPVPVSPGNRRPGRGYDTTHSSMEDGVNWDQVAGRWNQVRGFFREHWARLTDDDLELIAGARERLLGILQRRYGATREEVERQVQSFETRFSF